VVGSFGLICASGRLLAAGGDDQFAGCMAWVMAGGIGRKRDIDGVHEFTRVAFS
jgi:hypothetical protein